MGRAPWEGEDPMTGLGHSRFVGCAPTLPPQHDLIEGSADCCCGIGPWGASRAAMVIRRPVGWWTGPSWPSGGSATVPGGADDRPRPECAANSLDPEHLR